MRKRYSIFFSPSGSTKKITEEIAEQFGGEKETIDLLSAPPKENCSFDKDDTVLVGMPVFSGRIPAPCIQRLRRLKGNGTPAVAAAVYGNRDYDDALLELKTILEEQGFSVIGVGAFIARHSIFPHVAETRPDEQDMKIIREFASACAEMAEKHTVRQICVKGNVPYRAIASIPLKPSADKRCTNCGVCAQICPVGAILPEKPRRTDKEKCISCTACIAACPQKARSFPSLMHTAAAKVFEKKCARRKEPEYFV